MEYLKNTWYVAAHDDEVNEGPVSRRICDQLLVLFRTPKGEVGALQDRCPHRFVPLSKGSVESDGIRCPYHGLKFDYSGKCIEVPSDPEKNKDRICVKAYPAVSKYGVVWVWMGDPERADTSTIPVFEFAEDPNFKVISGYLSVKGNHQLIVDNLMDLSHVPFLHPETGYEPAEINKWKNTVELDGNDIWSMLWRNGIKPNAFQLKLWPDAPSAIDSIGHVRWSAPSVVLAKTAINEQGKPPEEGLSVPTAHLLTPETNTSSHYFWLMGRNACQDDTDVSEMLRYGIQQIFLTQDGPMIEDEQADMGDSTNLLAHRPVVLKADAAGLRARRVLAKLIHDENTTNPE